MARAYIVDGYNLIESHRGYFPGSLQAARERLINRIKEARPEGGARNKVTVVFDGQPGITFPPVKKLDVKFTAGREADSLIEDLVRKDHNPAAVTVVTDDRRLGRFVRADGARVTGTREFIQKLFPAQKKTESAADGAKIFDPEFARETTEELKKKWLKEDKKE